MKKVFGSFVLCLLASTHALSSVDEEGFPSPASVTGHKRPQSQESRTGASTPKVQRVNPDTDETSTQDGPVSFCLLKLLPYEILTHIAPYLSNQELLDFASTDQDLRALLLPIYFTKNSPTRTWTSALEFSADLQGRKDHFTFVAKIMPKLMHAVLTVYRCQTPAHITYFQHLLEEHGTFAIQGQALQETPLWQFLMTLEGGDPKNISLDSPLLGTPPGDGEHVFFNMLHYIQQGFSKDPATLPFYTPARTLGHRTLQKSLYEAHALIAQARAQTDPFTRAQTWDQILTTCTILTESELRTAIMHYTQAERATVDKNAKHILLTKIIRMWDAYLKDVPTPNAPILRMAAFAYQSAASPGLDPHINRAYFAKSVSLWETFFAQTPNPGAEHLEMAAYATTQFARLQENEEEKIRLLRVSAALWERCTHPFNNPRPAILSQAATTHFILGFYSPDMLERASSILKSASLRARHLDQVQNPDLADLKSAAATYTLAATYAPNPQTVKTFSLESARLWDRVLMHTPTPAANELHAAMGAYLNASKHSSNGPAKKVPLDKCTALYDAHLRQGNHPTQELQEKIDEVMAEMALCNQAPQQTRRANKGDAAPKNPPRKN
ncbi:MAG: hypothetical protein LCH26_07700 [Proteobacteria bacterium]|nr:hypothetical protein [Pseudomonadota bacterium]